eukprot:TRINITY_DN1545_c0_g1_i2.p1 TRINITY_DN1545_c0_g1~~TRINITY_DN1545_c0_g1_i2.p1  ORF type:complete len:294 (-),score=54.18 TRINITY_DN1545_c0_g1_i2:43-924(-)
MGSSASTEQPESTAPRYKVDYEWEDEKVTGHVLSNQDLPDAVPVIDFMNRDEDALNTTFANLKGRGYTFFKLEDHQVELQQTLKNSSISYFNLPDQEKQLNSHPQRENLGYINIESIREYIKLRPSDPDYLWPNDPQFTTNFHNLFDEMKSIVWSVFEELVNHIEETEETNSRLFDDGKLEDIKEFAFEKTSISMIYYYEQDQETNVCGAHKDTGILTFIWPTGVPSLEIWDDLLGKYVKVEMNCDNNYLIAFISEKLPLFSLTTNFEATPHRVIMPSGRRRLSMAMLLDVAK